MGGDVRSSVNDEMLGTFCAFNLSNSKVRVHQDDEDHGAVGQKTAGKIMILVH